MNDEQNTETALNHEGEGGKSTKTGTNPSKGGKGAPTKTQSFRLTDETNESFRALAKEIGGNPEETLRKLVEVYTLEARKQEGFMVGRRGEVERIENSTRSILSSFVALLDEMGDLENNVAMRYEKEIKLATENTLKAIDERDALQKELESTKRDLHNTQVELKSVKAHVKQLEADAKNVDITQALTKALEQLQAVPSTPDVDDKAK